MKILMLTPYLPYPTNSGGQIRSNNLIKHLSKKHEITLCSLVKNEEDHRYTEFLKPYCKEIYVFKRSTKPWTLKNILKTGFSVHPFVVVRNFSSEEKKALSNIIARGNFDIIHAETFYVSPHIPETDIPVVLVDQTIEYQVYQHYVDNYHYPFMRPLLYLDVLKVKYWESHYWKKAARVVAVSERDAKVMQQTVKGLKVDIVPNGVGDDFIQEVPLHYNKTLLFMGNYEWMQNSEAARILAREVYPQVNKKIKDAKLVIAGQNTQKIKDLQAKGIELVNIAVDDIKTVQNYYHNSGVLVAPLYGPGGTRLKILSAMSSRLPVVTTKIGITGINAIDGVNVLEGETPKEVAELTVKILQDKNLYKKIADNARKFVEENYSYEVIADKLDKVYQEVRK
ncbi:glycosyltransferase [Candidatus Parcubacteria bacterium]|nr:MAG: glycosyltransferase [Candidatus Parcubacteria bacterium]